MSIIRNLLNKLVAIAANNDQFTIDDFNPPLSRAEIQDKIGALGITFPDEIFEMYTWKNGVNRDAAKNAMEFWPGGVFTSLEESISEYEYALQSGRFPLNFFPIFNDGDEYLLYNLADDDTKGMIFYFCPKVILDGVPISIYDSLEIGLKTILEEFANGGYFFKNGSVHSGDYGDISLNNNPRSEFWKITDEED